VDRTAVRNIYREYGLRPKTRGWQSKSESDASNLQKAIKDYNEAVLLRKNDPEQFRRVWGADGDAHLQLQKDYIEELQEGQEERGRLRGIDERRLGGQEEPPPPPQMIIRPEEDQDPSAKREEASQLPTKRDTKNVTPLYVPTNPKGAGTSAASEALRPLGQGVNDYLTAYLQEGPEGDKARKKAKRANPGGPNREGWSPDYKRERFFNLPSENFQPGRRLSGADKLQKARDSQIIAAKAIARAADRWTPNGEPASISNIPMPTRDEFKQMVADGVVKAGDVLMSRDKKTGRVRFIFVTRHHINPDLPKGNSFQPPPSPF